MNGVILKEDIKNMIYVVRGKQVMLDSDLAKLYGCANGTKTINLAVKRNVERFHRISARKSVKKGMILELKKSLPRR